MVTGDGAQSLTRREAEVAGLAASGFTGPEITAHLTISVRTVDTHLARTYAKLGVTGRRELAHALGR